MGFAPAVKVEWPIAIEQARGIIVDLKPKKVAVASGEIDADGIRNVFPA
jgi:hypothetical protein